MPHLSSHSHVTFQQCTSAPLFSFWCVVLASASVSSRPCLTVFLILQLLCIHTHTHTLLSPCQPGRPQLVLRFSTAVGNISSTMQEMSDLLESFSSNAHTQAHVHTHRDAHRHILRYTEEKKIQLTQITIANSRLIRNNDSQTDGEPSFRLEKRKRKVSISGKSSSRKSSDPVR